MSTREPAVPVVTERKTAELCGNEVRPGLRCMRGKHHDGDHECYLVTGAPARWK
jgi:hypothetical protein